MSNRVEDYASIIEKQFKTGHALEHAYRPALERLMSSFEDVHAVNDPKRSEHGNPDFIFLKDSNKNIILGYAEAKDITVNLDKTEKTNQMHRYSGYENLFLTDYLEFRFYQNGDKYQTVSIGSIENNEIVFRPENYSQLENELSNFLELPPESIKNGKRLAQIMGAKARRIRDNVVLILLNEKIENKKELEKIYEMMQSLLVHDLNVEKFADMYAQTLVYGLFVARYNDKTLESFTRQEARDLVPKSNPFLQHFFDHIVGPDFVTSLSRIVDELCEVFEVSDVHTIVHKHLKILDETTDKDPIIHFYEDFLKEYDPQERKKMGAYYTPIPVVQFIIRQVDEVLKRDFGLMKGLADTSKTSTGTYKNANKKTQHRVQVLDPAVGTATFLNEIIKYTYKQFEGQEGRWQSYVEQDLVPRLFGFELMMAPYTIAHLKLGMTLQESGVKDLQDRLNIYLTNTLEEGVKNQQDIFSFGLAEAVSDEGAKAASIKHDNPIMVIVGNPPYSGVSSNNTDYANSLVNKYKVEPGGRQKLQERKHWLNDDYVKFIAFAEDMIDKNGSGIVAMITNNGYLDNPTFRGMRWHLAQTFDDIYVLDLHGNSKKKEIAPDGSKDENVFDIQQGVAIVVAVKKSNSIKPAKVYHADSYGKRKYKFAELNSHNIKFKQISLDNKNLYFLPKNTEGQEQYEKGIKINELFLEDVTGIVTMGDNFIVDEDKSTIAERVQKLANGEYDEATLNQEFGLGKNYAKFVLENAENLVFDESKLVKIDYRPFDTRWTYFDNKVIWRWRERVMRNFVDKKNLGLVFKIGNSEINSASTHITDTIIDFRSWSRPGMQGGDYVASLYIYHDDGTRTLNFDTKVFKEFSMNLVNDFNPEEILDYIYALLYSPKYREQYKEFLKIDFPRIPAPKNDEELVLLAKFGKELRELHLMTSSEVDHYDTTFPIQGSDIVEDVKYWAVDTHTSFKDDPEPITHLANTVSINKEQYFGNVPELAWNFYIGGYQPAQKWLKDRKGKKLTNEDIEHYQKIIKVLLETNRIMKEIHKIWSPK